jgi:hypothetical protein
VKTIKTKKSVGKAYVFSYNHFENGPYYNTNQTKKLAIEARDNTRCRCDSNNISEISEVELFEEVIEQVPHIVERYYFVVCGEKDDGIHTRKKHDIKELKELREEFMGTGYNCSEIKLLREEF